MSFASPVNAERQPAQAAAPPRRISNGLHIGSSHDSFEREADRVADVVTAGSAVRPQGCFAGMSIGPRLQRKCECGGSGECEECKAGKPLQRKSKSEAQPADAPSIAHVVLSSPGRPLDETSRRFFEPRFQHDFSKVRIHVDDKAAESARSVAAQAYAVGNHVVFGAGFYSPSASEGRRLLAHELAHVRQQERATGSIGHGSLAVAPSVSRSEQQAERAAASVNRGRITAEAPVQTGTVLSRQPWRDLPKPSGCDTACKALQSMQNAAAHICELAGEADEHCTSAHTRVATAEKTVADASCQCPTHPAPVTQTTRTFALTFDDGPHSESLGKGTNLTEKVLDTLKTKNVKAGFFIQAAAEDKKHHQMRGSSPVGKKLISRMHAEGHVVGVHTGGKKDHELHIDAQKAGRLKGELTSAKSFIKGETGEEPTLVRPPKMKYDTDVLKTYAAVGLKSLLWDIDGDGGGDLGLKELKKRLTNGIQEVHDRHPPWKGKTPSHPKIVVLHHDIQAGTAKHLGTLIEHIRDETKRISGGTDVASFSTP